MRFADRYTTSDRGEEGKTIITEEAYAVCELLVEIKSTLEATRIQNG